MNGQPHPVSRRPQCRSCGEPALESARAWRPVVTVPRPKQAHAGGHRTLSAERVLDRYGHLADSVTGIVGELRRDRRVLAPFHGYLSGHNLAIANSSIASVMAGLQMQSGGKGITDLDAKAGALCEALERYCGSRSGNEATVSGSYRQLGAVAIHPNDCQLFHERQFSDRARWNSSCAAFQRIPEPFDERKVIEWTPLWSLAERRHRLLPTDMLYYQGDRAGRAGIWADSNGNAAGSSIEEGILQGFLELVERDAVALWWYNRTRHPEVDLESFDDDWLARLRTEYLRIGREIWVVDVTSDLAIPVMAAISRKTGQVPEEIVLGFGAHFDPRLALRQALGEVNQLLAVATGGDAGGTGSETAGSGTTDRHLRDWLKRATIANQPYLRPTPDAATHRAEDYNYCPRADLQHDIDHICALARRHRLNILVLDQTRPDVKLPVVKVVVPGLRHFWARFAPGRLYDVPVKLGRVAESTPYEKLNPIPLFF